MNPKRPLPRLLRLALESGRAPLEDLPSTMPSDPVAWLGRDTVQLK